MIYAPEFTEKLDTLWNAQDYTTKLIKCCNQKDNDIAS